MGFAREILLGGPGLLLKNSKKDWGFKVKINSGKKSSFETNRGVFRVGLIISATGFFCLSGIVRAKDFLVWGKRLFRIADFRNFIYFNK